jgi:hypothetical protein
MRARKREKEEKWARERVETDQEIEMGRAMA